jgi:hypothetical protein
MDSDLLKPKSIIDIISRIEFLKEYLYQFRFRVEPYMVDNIIEALTKINKFLDEYENKELINNNIGLT